MADIMATVIVSAIACHVVADVLPLNNYAGRCYAKYDSWNSHCGRWHATWIVRKSCIGCGRC